MNIFNVISLFGGIALFLYGMRIMGDGLRQSSSAAFKNALGSITSNPVSSFLVGLVLTAIIQSSSATIVITSGLVGAGMITLHQSLGIILGANVGTTVTGQLIRLMDINASETSILNLFKPATLAPIAATIGILMIMLFKFKGSDTVGEIAMGFGILFTGLMSMTAAVSPLSSSPAFTSLFTKFADMPLMGFLAGVAVAVILQSASAAVGILQALSVTGQLTMNSVFPIIIGIYFGNCITIALMCSAGAKRDAKRTGIVHILFNACQIVLAVIAVFIINNTGIIESVWNAPVSSGGIADLNTIYKLSCAIIVLPFCGLLEKASGLIVKEENNPAGALKSFATDKLLDKAFYKTPSLAFSSASESISTMLTVAIENYREAIENMISYRKESEEAVNEREELIDYIEDHTENYLIGLSSYVDAKGSELINYNIKCASEAERIGDLSVNIFENAQKLSSKQMGISPSAKEELQIINDLINEILDYAKKAFISHDIVAAKHIEPLEETMDELIEDLRNRHVDRLKTGACNADTGSAFLDVLVNTERISDQCSNIAVHTISLYDPKIANAQHEYLNSLHMGSDESFNREYEAAKEKYLTRLADIAW